MCRLYALHATEPTKVECGLVRAQNALMVQSQGDAEGLVHGHGWGVADYPDGAPVIERQTWAAWKGERFAKAAARTYARTVVAHVRKATVGPAHIDNTHPFVFGRYIFAHNGTLPAFESLRPRLLSSMDPIHRDHIRGDTDSEHIFMYFMTLWSRGSQVDFFETVRQGLGAIVVWAHEAAPDEVVGLNVVVTDGERMVVSRYNRSLWMLARAAPHACELCGRSHVHHEAGVAYRSFEVASEPVTHDEPWRPAPNGALVEIGPDVATRIADLPMRADARDGPSKASSR
ncbi:MAG: class II glutamine amidotransferase [Pseudomonadota bacterium]